LTKGCEVGLGGRERLEAEVDAAVGERREAVRDGVGREFVTLRLRQALGQVPLQGRTEDEDVAAQVGRGRREVG
jgi:hypothetical protein